MAKKIMTAKKLVTTAERTAKEYPTAYWWGCLGLRCTESSYNAMHGIYPSWYERNRPHLKIGKAVWGMDCVGLIKLILWGFDPAKTGKLRGGAKYCAYGVGDMNETEMIRRCRKVSTSFAGIKEGEAVWLPGHIGIYIGRGLVCECTPRWKNGVQITALGNLGGKKGYETRTWVKRGCLPWVDYSDAKAASHIDAARTEVKAEYMKAPSRTVTYGDTGNDVMRLQTIYDRMIERRQLKGPKLLIDGSFGDKTKAGCRAMQKMLKRKGMYKEKIDGCCGPLTRAAITKWLKVYAG